MELWFNTMCAKATVRTHRELCEKTLRSLRHKKRRGAIVKRNFHKVFRANPPRTLRKNFAFIASKKTPRGYC